MIKAITFDLDGVYFINGKSNFISSIEKLGISRDEVERVFLKSDEMNKLYKRGLMTDEQFWSWAIKEWNINVSVDDIIKLLIDGYEVDRRVVEIVKRVRKNGYKTLICSNNFPARITGLNNRFDFLINFDTSVFSYEIGDIKPSFKIFKALIEKSGVLPDEIVFADDNEKNIQNAKDLGINTFIFDDFDGFLKNLDSLDVRID